MTYSTSKFNLLKWFLFAILFCLAVLTRFIPNSEGKPGVTGLIFDEAYFIPQTEHYFAGRYYFDIHPPLAKLLFAIGADITTPNLQSKVLEHKDILRNKVDGFTTVMNLDGVRLAPKILGTLTPLLVYLIMWNLLTHGFKVRSKRWNHNIANTEASTINTFIAFAIGLAVTLENSFILEARFALITQILIFFMVLTMYSVVKYLYTSERLKYLWLLFIAISFGFAISTKWLALGILPVVIVFILLKEYRSTILERDTKFNLLVEKYKDELDAKLTKITKYIYSRFDLVLTLAWKTTIKIILMIPVILAIYLAIYAIHFSKFSYIEFEDSNRSDLELFCKKCVSDLDNGTHSATIFEWVIATTQIADKYNKGVPALDYGKSDEIGSEWLKWPIMARPIIGYWQSWDPSNPNTDYSFYSLIGNPFNWIISLVGVVGIFILSFGKLLGMALPGEKSNNKTYLLYFSLLLLYFSNWLPFATIPRVMYLYHYLPAMLFGLISFGLLLQYLFKSETEEDTNELEFKNQSVISNEINADGLDIYMIENHDISVPKVAAICILCIFIMLSFISYMSFTYAMPTSRSMFEMRSLIKDWNMKWPGNK